MSLKRLLDLCICFSALTVLSPLLLLTALSVRATLGRPILFRQRRVGMGGVPITVLKFRTMRQVDTSLQGTSGDSGRLTRLGRLLRATSLDELPQLWNVLKGEMTLVGPRPLLPEYLPRYTPFQRRRHEVKPGITGWAQINGRNSLSWDRKFELDVWYVDNSSFWLDVKILATTVCQVVRRNGISQPGHATMPEFLGAEAGHNPQRAS